MISSSRDDESCGSFRIWINGVEADTRVVGLAPPPVEGMAHLPVRASSARRALVATVASLWLGRAQAVPPPKPLGETDTKIVIVTSVFGGMLIMLAILAAYRACRRRNEYVQYSRVAHGLDDEEQQFKKALDSQADDAVDEMFRTAGGEDLEFDQGELDQIEMLEKYRTKLVADAGIRLEDQDEVKDEARESGS